MSLHSEARIALSNDEEATLPSPVKKLKVSTMSALKAGGSIAQTGTLDEYSNGSKAGKTTTFSDQSASKATGIKDNLVAAPAAGGVKL